MKEYDLKVYEDSVLTKIKKAATELNIISLESYLIDEQSQTINIYNTDSSLPKDRFVKFSPRQDLRLNNLLPKVSLYSDFIKISPDPLRSRNALDFLEQNGIKDILTFHKDIDLHNRIYISFAVDHPITNIAQHYKQYQKIADYLFNRNSIDYKEVKLLYSANIMKEQPKSLTNKELQILSYLTKGMNALEISQARFISKRTVDKHIENIRKKLNSSSTSSLIAKYAFWQNNSPSYAAC